MVVKKSSIFFIFGLCCLLLFAATAIADDISDPILKKLVEKGILTKQEAKEKFGFLIDAFRYGAPPHGGIALGLDRLIMLLVGTDNIRDTIAFPKTTSATSLMDGAPSPVDKQSLKDLHLSLARKKPAEKP